MRAVHRQQVAKTGLSVVLEGMKKAGGSADAPNGRSRLNAFA